MLRNLDAAGLRNACLLCRARPVHVSRLGPVTSASSASPSRLATTKGASSRGLRAISASHSFSTSVERPDQSKTPENESTENSKSLDGKDPTPDATSEEATVHEARQRFRDTLPKGYLTDKEYDLYVRLYGPPLRETTPEDVGIPFNAADGQPAPAPRRDPNDPVLLRDSLGGGFEEVAYTSSKSAAEASEGEMAVEEIGETFQPDLTDDQKGYINAVARNEREYAALVKLQKDFEAANLKALEEAENEEEEDGTVDPAEQQAEDVAREEAENAALAEETALTSAASLRQLQAASIGVEEEPEVDDDEDVHHGIGNTRTHPYSQQGRFSTNPKTLLLPQNTFSEPIAGLLDRTSTRHVREAAEAALGGRGLPNSPTTPALRKLLPQQAIGLEAAQNKMSPIQADAYIATVLPPAYAATMSALVEVRKRLGTEWLRKLINRAGGQGPRVLDVGAGGAGLAAWQDILQAEWDVMRDTTKTRQLRPSCKKTVIVGSDELRHRISRFLDDTTFLPRLPDYVHSADIAHRKLDAPQDPLPKKTFDVIIASYILLPVEGYRRKAMLDKLWSLLSPDGGVLVFVEKGHPRGFEAIADVREKLVRDYLRTPADPGFEPTVTDESDPAYQAAKEPGMIVAPCTNHRTCPMYTTPGLSKGRKDFCSFQQRYYRPRFLQQILGASHRNHDDVRFSYVAIRRGGPRREGLLVGDEATRRAFEGYEGAPEAPDMLSLPRQVLAPLKRKGHVQLEVCTPSGRIERWTVPKSRGKQSYHDARKALWGDLWALGAKSRVQRSIRLGRGEGEGDLAPRKKAVNKVSVEVERDGSVKHARESGGGPEKRSKGGRRAPRKSLRAELMGSNPAAE